MLGLIGARAAMLGAFSLRAPIDGATVDALMVTGAILQVVISGLLLIRYRRAL